MSNTKELTRKQLQRVELDKVLDFNESELVKMQQKGWKDLSGIELNILENFLVVALGTLRHCPPAYVMVASNNAVVRAKELVTSDIRSTENVES